MIQYLLVCFVVLGPVYRSLGEEVPALRVESKFRQKRYESVLLAPQLTNAPKWAANEESPPLSPKKAMETACRQAYVSFGGPERQGGHRYDWEAWQAYSLRLQRVRTTDAWVYVVDCSLLSGGYTAPIQIIVTMDGRAVPPKLIE